MATKYLILILAFTEITTVSWSQPGFNKFYREYPSDNFSRLIVDNDTIICIGTAYDSTITPSPLQVWMVKLDTFGNVIQSKLYKDSLNAFLSMDFISGNIINTTQGNYAFAVSVFGRQSIALIQVDRSFEVKSFFEYSKGGNYSEFYEQILEMPDGGFMIAGTASRPNYKQDGFVRRIDKYGNVLWFKYYGDYNKDESMRCIVSVSNNRFVVGGGAGPNSNDPFGARAGIWVLDSNGVVQHTWIGPNDPNLLIIRGLKFTTDGGFIANGRTYWGEGDWGSKVQISLMKFDSLIQLQWLNHVGPNNYYYTGIYDMTSTPDGHYIVAGERTAYGDLNQPSTDWGGWLYKFSEQGDSIWARADNAPPGYAPTGEFVYGGVGVLSSGSIVAGGKGDIDNKFVGWVVKVTADGCMDTLFCHTSAVSEVPGKRKIAIYPNPSNGFITIDYQGLDYTNNQILLFNVLGQMVKGFLLPKSQTTLHLSLQELPEGVYWYVIPGTPNDSGKIVIKY